MVTFIDPDEVKQDKSQDKSFVDPDSFKDPDSGEDPSFISRVGTNLEVVVKPALNTAIDLADVVLSTPAWLGGMGAGLVAAEAHSADLGQTNPPGEHFGAAQAVKEGVLEAYGNPVRRSLTALGILSPAAEGESTSPVATAMGKVGEGIQAVGKKVKEVTGSEEARHGAEFFTEMLGPPLILKGAHGVYVGGKKVATGVKDSIVTTPEVKKTDPEYAESKIKPEETIADVIHRKYERDALAKKLDEGEASMGELPKQEVPKVDELAATQALEKADAKALQAIKHLNNPPESYKATDPINIKNWAIKERDKHSAEALEESGLSTLLRIINDKSNELITGDQHPSVKADHGITIARKKNYIDLVEIPDNLQKQGLGTKIVENLEYDIKKEGHTSVHLSSKPEAVGFWEKQGYRVDPAPVIEAGENIPMSKSLVSKGRTSDTALAYTDKDGVVTLNDAKIETDFKAGFPYIFDATTPTGKQKAAIFEHLGVTKEDLVKAIPDLDTYKAFLKAQEESHIKNGDRVAYPRTSEGKADLMHPDAIAIEARATMDALKEINKPSPEDIVTSNVYEFITKEAIDHPATVEGASMLIEKSLNSIIADNRLVEIRSKGIIEAVPDIKVREQMTRSIENQFKGDKLDPKVDTKAIEVLKDVKTHLKEVGDKARKVGLLEELRSNYVPHILDFSKSKLTPEAQASLLDRIANTPKDSKLVRDFTQERQFEFLRELEKVVEGTGVVVHTDIAKIVDAYGKAMQTAIIQKSMIDFLKANKAADGNPWLMPDNAISKELKYVSFEGKGTKAIRDLRIHPDLVDSMNFMFRQHDPHIVLRALGGVSHLTKALNVVGSLFHAKSLVEVGLLTDPALFLKEVATAGAGTRAALRVFEKDGANPLIDLLVREGGLMIKVEDVQRSIVADSGVFLDGAATKLAGKVGLPEGKDLKVLQHITDPLDRVVLQKLNTFTWDYMHAAQKLNVATHLFNKMKLKNPDMTDIAIAKSVSAYANNAFGGINWLQVANQVQNKFLRGVSLKMAGIQGREWAQIVMFAPDWTVSTLRAFTTALPKELAKPQNWELRKGVKGIVNPRTQGDLARRYVVNTAIMWVTILNAANIAISGHSMWDNKDPTRLDLGDGTSMQAAKHSMEAIHWLQHPDKTLGNKLGFWPKALFVSTTATAYPSPDAPKLKDTSLLGRAKAVGLLGTPFALSSAVQAPEGQGAKRAALSTLGLPIYGVAKQDLKKAQKKGRVEAKKKKLEEKRKK